MSKFLAALELGMEILTDVEALLTGSGANFSFSFKGKQFTVTINPGTTPPKLP